MAELAASGGPFSRVSNTRCGVIGTNRPALADAAGTDAPLTSTMTAALDEVNTSTLPDAPSFTIDEFARMFPACQIQVRDERPGLPSRPRRHVPVRGSAINGDSCAITAVALAGTPQRPATRTRMVFPPRSMTPAPGTRVSASRHGMNALKAVVASAAATAERGEITGGRDERHGGNGDSDEGDADAAGGGSGNARGPRVERAASTARTDMTLTPVPHGRSIRRPACTRPASRGRPSDTG